MSGPGRGKTNNFAQSVFPTRTMVSSQLLVKQHLNAHNRKLQNVKAVVDTSVPYSYWNNPTTRGYQRSPRSPPQYMLSNDVSRTKASRDSELRINFSDDPAVDQLVKAFMRNNQLTEKEGMVKKQRQLSQFGELLQGGMRENEPPLSLQRSGTARSTQSKGRRSDVGDILLVHRHRFTEEKPFSPRTIRSNASSKLRGLRCYNPPVRTVKIKAASAGQAETGYVRPTSVLAVNSELNGTMGCTNRQSKNPNPPPSIQSCEGKFEFLEKSDKLRYKTGKTIPSLQPIRSTNLEGSHTNPSSQCTQNLDWVDQWIQNLPASDSTNENLRLIQKRVDDGVQAKLDTWKERINDKQKALLYLSFIEAVTNDVLARGVFTDRNLNSIISEHVIRNEFGMSKEQLQQAADQLRTQLRITDDPHPEEVVRPSEEQEIPQESELKSGLGDERVKPVSSRQSSGTELGYCESPLDPLLAASPSLSTRPPVAPARENRTPGSPSAVKQALLRKSSENKRKPADTDPSRKNESGTKTDPNDVKSGVRRGCTGNSDTKNSLGSNQPYENHTHSTNSDAHWSGGDSTQDQPDHEDTLNDPTSMPILSSSAQPIDPSEMVEPNSSDLEDEQPQSYSFQFEDDGLGKSPDNQPQDQCNDPVPVDEPLVVPRSKQTRVTFASEAEFFSIRAENDSTTSVSSLTNLTRLASPDLTSPPKGEPDLSSLQAIAEGDSNVTLNSEQDKEYMAGAYTNDILLPS